MKRWYNFQLKKDDESVVDVQITDFIGDWVDDLLGYGVTAKHFVDDLAKLPEAVRTVRVHINSPGGDVFGAINIANALRDQRATKGRKVEVVVDGLAASAASLVMMAGDPVRIADNGMIMIHNPWTVAMGDADDMRHQAELLDQIRNSIITTYQWKADLSDKELVALMDAETWMDADEAVERGFADAKVEGLQARASIDPRRVEKLCVPERFQDRVKSLLKADVDPEVIEVEVKVDTSSASAQLEELASAAAKVSAAVTAAAPPVAAAEDVMTLCAEARLDVAFAARLVRDRVSPEDARQLVSAERERLEAETARRAEVSALCAKFNLRSLEPHLSGLSADDARAVVAEVRALLDKVEIDTGIAPDPEKKKAANSGLYGEAYRRLNQPSK